MEKKRSHLMGEMILKNKKYFIGATIFTLFFVLIDFITPMLLAEALDNYINVGGTETPTTHMP